MSCLWLENVFVRSWWEKELYKNQPLSSIVSLVKNDLNLKSIDTQYVSKCLDPNNFFGLCFQLVGDFIEEYCVNPTFIIDHPQVMSPLAKW